LSKDIWTHTVQLEGGSSLIIYRLPGERSVIYWYPSPTQEGDGPRSPTYLGTASTSGLEQSPSGPARPSESVSSPSQPLLLPFSAADLVSVGRVALYSPALEAEHEPNPLEA
jgi:hypothetical protein